MWSLSGHWDKQLREQCKIKEDLSLGQTSIVSTYGGIVIVLDMSPPPRCCDADLLPIFARGSLSGETEYSVS